MLGGAGLPNWRFVGLTLVLHWEPRSNQPCRSAARERALVEPGPAEVRCAIPAWLHVALTPGSA